VRTTCALPVCVHELLRSRSGIFFTQRLVLSQLGSAPMGEACDAEAGLFEDRDALLDDRVALLWSATSPEEGSADRPCQRWRGLRVASVAVVCGAVAVVGACVSYGSAPARGPEMQSSESLSKVQVEAQLWQDSLTSNVQSSATDDQVANELQQQLGYAYPQQSQYGQAAGSPTLHSTDQFVDNPTDVAASDVAGTPPDFDQDGYSDGYGASYANRFAPWPAAGSDPYQASDPYNFESDSLEIAALHPNDARIPTADYNIRSDDSETAAFHGADSFAASANAAPAGAELPDISVDSSEEAALHRGENLWRGSPSSSPSPPDRGFHLDSQPISTSSSAPAVLGDLQRPDYTMMPIAGEVWAGKTFTKTTTLLQTSTTTTTSTADLDSLFCFAVMMSTGYELPLMREQCQKGVGVFGCERYSVLSNAEVELSSDPASRVVTQNIGDLHCEYGGPYNLALNSEVFVRAWKRVFKDAYYRHTAWSVKADPDAVFLPGRLRTLVKGADADAQVYLNNCNEGLHGPIEVLSLGAMRVFDRNVSDCETLLQKEFTWAGEDVFLRHCLGYLRVNRVDSFTLLKEDHCFHKNPALDGCATGEVSFHPFKNNDGWFKCLAQAQESEPKGKGSQDGAARTVIKAKRML